MTRFSKRNTGTRVTSRHLGDLASTALSSLDDQVQKAPWRVADGWDVVVGESVAKMTRVIGFNRGVLTVRVANSTLLSLLARQEKRRLIEELQKRAPGVTIKDILFRLGEI